MISNFFSKIRQVIEFFLIYLIYLIVFFFPISLVTFLGGTLFKLIGPFTKTHKIIKKNLDKIFPDQKKLFLNQLAKECWANTGKTFFELLILPKIINKKNYIKIEGVNHLDKIKKDNEKVIFISIHQSNWEILVPTIDMLGVPVGGIYRHINNPFINKLILNIREKSLISKKSFYTPKGRKSAKDIIEGIKRNISIVLLIDQKDSSGEIVDFFKYPSKTQIGFIKIARKNNMKIIPIENIRNQNNEFTLKFHPPLEKFANDLSDNEVMKKIHFIIETWIRNNPSSWFLQHNRFN